MVGSEDFRVRHAGAEDAEGIAAVHLSSLRDSHRGWVPDEILDRSSAGLQVEHWRRWVALSRTTTLVTDDGGDIAGFATLHPAPGGKPEVGEVAALFVRATHWRRGLGRGLVERTLAEARARGFRRLAVWVLDANARARRLYESVGFRPTGEKRAFSEGQRDARDELRYRLHVPAHGPSDATG